MNKFYNIFPFILACLFLLFTSCKEEIIEPPAEHYKGKIVYGLSNSKIFIIDFNIENQEPLILFEPGIEPAVSPDGEKIVFTVGSSVSHTGTLDLFIMDIDGSNIKNLTATNYLSENFPDWCPDNNRVIFDSRNEAIYTINMDGTNLRPVTDTTSNDFLSFLPSWSPDGNCIAYINVLRPVPGESQDKMLKVISINDGSDILLDNSLSGNHIKWSPGSKQLLYEKYVDKIFIWDFNTNTSHPLDVNDIVFINATWLPNGNILSCGKRDSDSSYSIYTIFVNNLNNTTQILSGFHGIAASPIVIPSPDGSHIAIFGRKSNEEGLNLYISKVDGSELKKVWHFDESNENIYI